MEAVIYAWVLLITVQLTCAGMAPEITTRGHTLKTLVGTIAILRCDTTGQPQPNIKWQKDGMLISEFGRRVSISEDKISLRLHQLKLEDQGNYTCLARNRHGSATKTMKLIVMIQPETEIVSPRNLTFMEQTNQEIRCRARAVPQPIFEWLTNQHERIRANDSINSSDTSNKRIHSVDRQVNQHIFESILFFQPITFKDFGSFVCAAYNDAGHGRESVTLDVHFPPKALSKHEFSEPVVWWDGHDTKMTCIVAGRDLPNVTWAINGRVFKCRDLQQEVEVPKITSTCTIKHREDGGPGNYSCSAKNSLGKVLVHEFQVRENFPPPPVEFTPTSIVQDEVTLSFNVPIKDDTPLSSYVLASYTRADEEADTKQNPVFERMGDVNQLGEGTVKLVGIKQNSNYIVKVRARNLVGFGPETAVIINTALQTTPATSTTSKPKDVPIRESARSVIYEDGQENQVKDSIYYVPDVEYNVPRAYEVVSLDSGAADKFAVMWMFLIVFVLII